MKALRYSNKISTLEFFLVLTGLVLMLLPSPKSLEARPTDQDGLRYRSHTRLNHSALGKLSADRHAIHSIRASSLDARLRVVHETGKLILLTNGEQIKLYPLKESDLTPSGGYYVIQSTLNFTTNGWKTPLISNVAYVLDETFCYSSDGSRVHKNGCLVIFWLDKRNRFLRYGSFKLDRSNRIELLSSTFNAQGNLKSLSEKNKKKVLLHELPPIDLCKRASEFQPHLMDCQVSNLTIDSIHQGLNISLIISASPSIADNGTKNLENRYVATLVAHKKPKLDFQSIQISTNSNNNLFPDAIATAADKNQCFWLNANYKLYSSNLVGQNVHLLGKLSPKPSIRSLGEIHSFRDILFISDIASKSIMSYNITQRASVVGQKPQEVIGRKKFDVVERLPSTHQVLLVETSPIYGFNVIDLDDSSRAINDRCDKEDRFKEVRVIDDDLTEHLKKHKLDLSYERHLLEDIMQLTLVFLSILLVIFIVIENKRGKQMKSDRESFVNREEEA